MKGDLTRSEGISRIASKVGIPLAVDALTAGKKRLAYARVCVQVNSSATYPEEIPISLDGDVFSLKEAPPGVFSPNKFDILQQSDHNQNLNASSRQMATNVKAAETTHQATTSIQASKSTRVWNARGFNSPDKVMYCKQFIKFFKLDMLCILENRIQASSLQYHFFSLSHELFTPKDNCNNFECSKSCRISIKWNALKLNLTPIVISAQLISSSMTYGNNAPFHLYVVYASNSASDRTSLWDQLKCIASGHSAPWIIMGDFNYCHFSSEKIGGSVLTQNKIWELNSLVFNSNLIKLHSVGNSFTWFNQRADCPIRIKLDGVLVNEWMTFSPIPFTP
ncbi:hypothetical protein M5K25_021072 [Dendrobium thyrsiflorum]|uniref:Endonuclease/exonuclease/phosphatase domain-containing protein n=1 Tax=Dendrobium thyrsiflorum TaxID=117978 RepID=A0ABD0UCC1_DENTH